MDGVAARRSQAFAGVRRRARLARKDAAVAVNATVLELACLNHLTVTLGQQFIERGVEAREQQCSERTRARHVRKAGAPGDELIRLAEGDVFSGALTAARRMYCLRENLLRISP